MEKKIININIDSLIKSDIIIDNELDLSLVKERNKKNLIESLELILKNVE